MGAKQSTVYLSELLFLGFFAIWEDHRLSSILIENGAVVTVDDTGSVYDSGYVLVVDDRIGALGAGQPPVEMRHTDALLLDTSHMAVMPGMVNAHTHLFQTFFRGLADDEPLLEWLKAAIWPVAQALTEEDAHVAAMLGLVENIRGKYDGGD